MQIREELRPFFPFSNSKERIYVYDHPKTTLLQYLGEKILHLRLQCMQTRFKTRNISCIIKHAINAYLVWVHKNLRQMFDNNTKDLEQHVFAYLYMYLIITVHTPQRKNIW